MRAADRLYLSFKQPVEAKQRQKWLRRGRNAPFLVGSLLQADYLLPGTARLRKDFEWQGQQVIRQCAGE